MLLCQRAHLDRTAGLACTILHGTLTKVQILTFISTKVQILTRDAALGSLLPLISNNRLYIPIYTDIRIYILTIYRCIPIRYIYITYDIGV